MNRAFNFQRITRSICILLMITVLIQGLSVSRTEAQDRYTFLTAYPGGAWYPMCAALGELYNEKLSQYGTWTVESGAGSVNNRTLAQGKADVAWVSSDLMWMSREGLPPYKVKDDQSKFRTIMSLSLSQGHWVVLKDSGIKSFADLKGKRIAIGKRGASSNVRGYFFLEAYGIGKEDFKVEYIGANDAAKALTDRRIDALIEFIAAPAPLVIEIASKTDIRLLSLPHDSMEAKAMVEKHPFMVPAKIPAGTYKGVDYEVDCYGVPGSWMALSTVPEEVIYQMVKVTDENWDRLLNVHKSFNQLKTKFRNEPWFDKATGRPYHKGVLRYYKEKGVLK
ncbi:MAG: TAXI family TRAP transporter solute-binding subunit [Desulfobacteraceae bacterium]|nr:TAXI family TRAP transporter solute-binding subunit [Desulfobacteraceae bacterium]